MHVVSSGAGAPLLEVSKRPLKIVYGALVSAAASIVRRNYDLGRSVLIFGSPRSGTTWLMNLLCTAPGMAPVFEPLNRAHDPWVASMLEDEWLRRVVGDDDPALEQFLATVLAGHHLTRWSSNRAPLMHLLSASRLVVKFVRAMRAIGWIIDRFPSNPKVVIVRHPCAVVGSMVKSPGIWNDWNPQYVENRVVEVLGEEHRPLLAGLKTREQRLAAWWAADTRAMLDDTSPANALLLPYELLVFQPNSSLRRLFAHVHEPVPPDAVAAVRRPSETANADAAVRRGRNPLEEWRVRLDRRTVRDILDVVEACGIRFYSDELLPNVTLLERAHRVQAGGVAA